MKPLRTIFLLCAALGASSVRADTLYEREFKRLSEQRESDLGSYTLKVNRTYRAALEKLLAAATQAKDYDAVAKIVEAMKALPETAPADPMAPPTPGGSRLEQLLVGHPWLLNGVLRYTFMKSGHFTRINPGGKVAVDRGTFKINGNSVSLNWSDGAHHGLTFDEKTGALSYSCPEWPAMDGKPLTPAP